MHPNNGCCDCPNSLLHGVDLGSIPFLNGWVNESVRVGLSNYVSPRYVGIGIEELLHNRGSTELTSAPPNLDNLRQTTRFSVSNPRTSMSEGMAIASIADKLESRRTSGSSAPVTMDPVPAPKEFRRDRNTIMRPVTELSRLALDRHSLKEDNPIRPVTELARLGLDRWLDSKVITNRSDDGTYTTSSCLLYTSPSPRDKRQSRMPSSA